MMTSQHVKPLSELQNNTSAFFNQFYQKYQSDMNCQAGCSQCCHVDLSVFEGEAILIVEWYQALPLEEKKLLSDLWKGPDQASQVPKKQPCTFLRDNKCTIYASRPVICRTQGVVLQVKTQIEKNNTEIRGDVCPLNFKTQQSFPPQKDWLDLDRLNALQSIAENFYQKNKQNGVVVNLPLNKDGRVNLKDLKKYLIKNAEFSA